MARPAPDPQPPPPRPAIDVVYRLALVGSVLGGFGWWGWRLGGGNVGGAALAAAFAIGAGVAWGIPAVPGDPSRRSRVVVPVPGLVRLGLEGVLVGLAAYGVWTSGGRAAAETLLTAAGFHYLLNWERVRWLLRR